MHSVAVQAMPLPDDGMRTAAAAGTLTRRDRVIVAALAAATAVYLSPFLRSSWQIYEDAAMLFRYAEHVSAGHGMVWNIGDAPVDGATDLLFTWLIAALHRAGIGIVPAARAIAAISHVTLVGLVYAIARRGGASAVMAALCAVYVAIGPGKAYVAGGFGTTLFALCVAIAWWASLRLAAAPSTARAAICGLAWIVAGVARPEGALLAAFVAGALATVWADRPERWRTVGVLAATGAVLGGAYWLWRFEYFGYPLPNPFYRKRTHDIYLSNLLITAKYGALHLGPFVVAVAAALWRPATRRAALLTALPVFLFLAAWVALSNEMNFFRRFQYPVAPMIALSWPWWGDIGGRARGLLAAAILTALPYQHFQYFPPRWQDDRMEIGQMLAPFADRGYTLATTEAGLLPFQSRWRAIDAWGLNDQWIAHHGLVTAEYLDRFAPELIMFPTGCYPAGSTDPFPLTLVVLDTYARDHGYRLALAFRERSGAAIAYYVRPGFVDADRLSARLAQWGADHGRVPARTPDCQGRVP